MFNGDNTIGAPATKKRENFDVDLTSEHESQAKKAKIYTVNEQPVVADVFEEEAVREVPATADLTSDAPVTESRVTLTHQVRHQVALPPNYPYIPLAGHVSPPEAARTYPFTLDPFQKVSINCIERSESVLVSAHTSAGKTVVAEYAIAQGLKNKQRVIYTSPIKALSNQKYRELQEEFGDVGLMTGDVTINPTASCLVMTTEILRAMLYRGSEIMREVAWVIFDEIHYLRDKARGVVWEETIILLPHQVHYVFLSATIPNAMEFAEWICKIHEQAHYPCHVVYTDFRPTPLQHYVFPSGTDGIYMVVDEKGVFREDIFQQAIAALKKDWEGDYPPGGKGKKSKRGRIEQSKGPSDMYKIVKMIMQKNYNPVIVFSFSKKDCEHLAQDVTFDFNDENERAMVQQVFTNAISSLSDDDRNLPQIGAILPLLKRGIGIHHSGLLPFLKEVTEILFQEGLIKVLFATETFSMGLNMPAKTVVFSNVKKFDGETMRYVSSGEYIQMSGRAGRRGLDERGIVFMMVTERMDPSVIKNMIKGEADHLTSAFQLKYVMILNMTRVEGFSPEYILQRSFHQFQNTASLPALEEELARLEEEKASLEIPDEEIIADYYLLREQLENFSKDMRDVINQPTYCLHFLQTGRLVRVKHDNMDFGYGMVVSFEKRKEPESVQNSTETTRKPQHIVDVLLYCDAKSSVAKNADGSTTGVRPCPENQKGEMMVVPVDLACLDGITEIRIFPPKDLKPLEQRNSVYKSMQEVFQRFTNGPPFLDPVSDMGIVDEGFKKLMRKIEVLESKLLQNPLHNSSRLPEIYDMYSKKMLIERKIKALKKKIQSTHSIMQLDELKCRKRVLRRLGYITASDVVDIKGRVACEINCGDELVLTEMLMNGVFNDLSVETTAAVMSCFIQMEAEETGATLKEEFMKPFQILKETARRIAQISIECKVPNMDEEEYVQQFHPDMMEIVYAWCKASGAKFAEICKYTSMFEGNIIRNFRSLDELLRTMVSATKIIGNIELENKFSEAMEKIRRDIIFAASLYL
ncbi:6385_t:CDS:10 [Ambispora gerdemannii]|uniref:6385_t:CDS:1 n=1 Tax=Ambispora gerdemannii TaxID=144530 RepID=A0A9N8V086_9GLOM|nr:6385_t:CDS:10 [Ambispora gerdemannii]